MSTITTSTNKHLIDLERELEADLTEAQRHIELGRRNAIDELNRHRESLGELCGEATLHIDLLAYDAADDLKRVRSQLGELHDLLAEREIRDLKTFDRFRDKFIAAMAGAERDLSTLNQCGDEWGSREQRIRDAWAALSRQLELARLHLMHEAQIAKAELDCEREELAAQIAGSGGRIEIETQGAVRATPASTPASAPVEFFAKVGAQIGRFLPGFRKTEAKQNLARPNRQQQPGGSRHD